MKAGLCDKRIYSSHAHAELVADRAFVLCDPNPNYCRREISPRRPTCKDSIIE